MEQNSILTQTHLIKHLSHKKRQNSKLCKSVLVSNQVGGQL